MVIDPLDVGPLLAILSFTVLLGAFYALLQAGVRRQKVIENWDKRVGNWLISHATPGMIRLFTRITDLGKYLVIRDATIVICVWLLIHRDWEHTAMLVVLVGGGNLINPMLQKMVGRDRPDLPQDFLRGVAFSFPSGHTMLATSFYLMVSYLSWVYWRTTMLGWIIVAFSMALIILIGISRLYLGVHFLTDVLGGWIAGSLLFLLLLLICNMLYPTLDII
jgi:undecaprenyl-diphosphatase